MRILLKDVRTGRYFQRPGVWVQKAEEAHDFKHESRVIEAWLGGGHDLMGRNEHDIQEIVLHSVRLGSERLPELRLFVNE
jgi:hypothetical protein